MEEQTIKKSNQKKACANCGAELNFKPGSDQLKCDYCGYEEFIESDKTSFEELELSHYLNTVGNEAHTHTISVINCKNCGANQHVEENYKSLACVYCNEPLILEDQQDESWIFPGAVVPFQLDKNKARQVFKKWVGGIWFAPNKLKKAALDAEGLHGLYVPYWTFDCNLYASYQGQRGDYYYETKRVRTKNGTRTQQVRKTRWSHASGNVSGFIDDILINASEKKRREIPSKISRWDLKNLVPFTEEYLSGFVTEKYTISLKDGHHHSFQKAKDIAYSWIRRDIGGDTQRISHADINLTEETFKHVLLPVYISSYIYNGKDYHFYVNGQTGQIAGKYPISFWKVFFVILLVIIIVSLIVVYSQ